MAFQLRPDESVGKGVKRVVRRQVDNALEELGPEHEDRDEAVHEARKRFKKVRAVLRLVRDELGDKVYRREDQCFRDAARPLTEVRDARVLVETLDNFLDHFAEEVSAKKFSGTREALEGNRQAIRARVLDESNTFAEVAAAVSAARERVRGWGIDHRGWAALRPGLRRVYRKGRHALAAAQADPTAERLHEWRKQGKYLWHQLQLLEPLWPAVLKELANQVHSLTTLLGDDHDLFVLRQTLAAGPDVFGGESIVEALFGLIDRRRAALAQEALLLGQRIYRDRPRAFVNRIKGYWKAWRSEAKAAVRA
jgi:CHAD domain-containing protein